jgi:uncharacterized protein (DUF1810 family)
MSRGAGAQDAADPFDLQRFVDAQDGVHERALREIQAGRKRSHWMWFVFPQYAGLGSSATSQRYAIRSLEEARAYLAHPVLGARLLACTRAVNALAQRDAHAIFGAPDDLKFHSSMTLFDNACEPGSPFAAALERCFGGVRDPHTLRLAQRNDR